MEITGGKTIHVDSEVMQQMRQRILVKRKMQEEIIN